MQRKQALKSHTHMPKLQGRILKFSKETTFMKTNIKYSSKSSGNYGENSEGNKIWIGKAQEEKLEKDKHGPAHVQAIKNEKKNNER